MADEQVIILEKGDSALVAKANGEVYIKGDFDYYSDFISNGNKIIIMSKNDNIARLDTDKLITTMCLILYNRELLKLCIENFNIFVNNDEYVP